MPEFLNAPFVNGPVVHPLYILIRLLLALAFGGIVAWIYLRTSTSVEGGSSFPTTLALLAVLIAMVTQVIGDNVARAFSLVGALSIVRFRTVVRDTKDTAYVIFAVVVGMAVGAQNPWVAAIGIVVIGVTAFAISARSRRRADSYVPFLLRVRLALGSEPDVLLGSTLDRHLNRRKLMSVSTARQGTSLDVIYEVQLPAGASPEDLVRVLNRIEGVQDIRIHRREFEPD